MYHVPLYQCPIIYWTNCLLMYIKLFPTQCCHREATELLFVLHMCLVTDSSPNVSGFVVFALVSWKDVGRGDPSWLRIPATGHDMPLARANKVKIVSGSGFRLNISGYMLIITFHMAQLAPPKSHFQPMKGVLMKIPTDDIPALPSSNDPSLWVPHEVESESWGPWMGNS